MSFKTYKYRFYPTPEQEVVLAKTFGCVRYVYNKALALRRDTYKETGKGISFKAASAKLPDWKREDEWLREVSSIALQQCLRHLDAAYNNFFKGRSRYPKFKTRKSRQSASFTRSGFKWDAKSKTLKIYKVGKIKVRWSRDFEANPSNVTLSRSSAGKYFVSIRIDEPNRSMPVASSMVGVDLGIENLAITSEGELFENQRITKRYAAKLKNAQKVLNRRQEGSGRWKRAKLRVAVIQERIANSRHDWTHKVTTQLIRDNQAIYVETLKSSNMMRNRKLSKSIADCSWFEFVRQLEYKADWYGRTFARIDRWEPTSKRCSGCGCVADKMPLNVRDWVCPECGAEHNRDINAAKNILAAGLAVTAQGETGRPSRDSSQKGKSRRTVNHSESKHIFV